MPRYIVTGPAAVVIVAGKRRYLDWDDPVPAGADEHRIKHLLDVGLIAALPEPDEPDDDDQGEGDEGEGSVGKTDPVTDAVDLTGLDLGGLRALAAERGVDLQGATRKGDIIAALEAAAE